MDLIFSLFCRFNSYTFAKSLDQDQAWQNVRLDLAPNGLTLLFLKELFLKSQQVTKSHENFPSILNLKSIRLPVKVCKML